MIRSSDQPLRMDAQRLRHLFQRYVSHTDVSPQQESAFRDYARQMTALTTAGAAIAASTVALIGWAASTFIYAPWPKVIESWRMWGIPTLVGGVTYVLGVRMVPFVQRHPTPFFTVAITASMASVGWGQGYLGGLELPWFYVGYLIPFVTIIFMIGIVARMVCVYSFSLAYVAGFFLPYPQNLEYQLLPQPLLVLFLAGLFATGVGHVIYHLSRNNFLSRQALAQRAEALEEVDRIKNDFFANISHELRTPLTLILGAFRSLDDTLDSDGRARIRETGIRNTARLLSLINDLLDLSRFDSGRARLDKRVVDIAKLINQVLGAFDSSSTGAYVRFSEPGHPVLANVDERQVKKVLYNLLSNALKFTDSRTGRVEVDLRQDQDQLELVVRDNGIGIAPDQLDRIFDRFSQVEGGASRRFEGTGIGLALVRESVNEHDGTVTVDSQVGRGTTFTVRLPVGDVAAGLAVSSDGEAELVDFLHQAARSTGPAMAPDSNPVDDRADLPRILLAEDNPDLRNYISNLLQKRYHVEPAADGVQALDSARAQPPDLVLTDMMMPRMNGQELLVELRRDNELRHLPVIFLTARAGTDARIEALQAGADDYLAKPFDEDELFARIENLLRARRQEKDLADLNRRLESRIEEQMAELVRSGELRRFLPHTVVDAVLGDRLANEQPFQRQKITVLFADLVGYTRLTSELEPEEAASILNEYFAEMTALTYENNGAVDKLIGDAVMSVFGPPYINDGQAHAFAAIATALKMQDKIVELARGWRKFGVRHEIGLRIGIQTGYATVGVFGSDLMKSFTAIGTPVNTAARLEADALPGQILCGGATWAMIENRVLGNAVGQVELKGIPQPVETWQVTGLR